MAPATNSNLAVNDPMWAGYAYTSITNAIAWIAEQERDRTDVELELLQIHDKAPEAYVWEQAQIVVPEHLSEGAKTLLYLPPALKFSVGGEYPRILVMEAARQVIRAIDAQILAATWARKSFLNATYEDAMPSCLQLIINQFQNGINRVAADLGYFTGVGIDLPKVLLDPVLRTRYNAADQRGPSTRSIPRCVRLFCLFYRALRKREKAQTGSKRFTTDKFIEDFMPVFQHVARSSNEKWPYTKARSIKTTCIKESGRVAKVICSIGGDSSPEQKLPPKFKQLLRLTESNAFRCPRNWKNILSGL